MSEYNGGDPRSLVPAGRCDLSPTAGSNPHVPRALADVARWPSRENKSVECELTTPISHYLRGVDWFRKFDEAKAGEELDKAIQFFDKSIQLDPNNVLAYRHRGKSRWLMSVIEEMDAPVNSGREAYDKAIQDIDEAIQLDPNNVLAHIERAEALFWGNSEEEARTWKDFDEAIRLDPTNASWYALRGIAWLEQRECDRSIEDLIEAILLHRGQRNIVVVFTKTEDHGEQFFDYEGGNPTLTACVRIDLYSHLASAYQNRGSVRLARKAYDKAIEDFNDAIRLNPQCGCAFGYRGQVWLHKNDYVKAIQDLGEAIRLNPNEPQAYYYRGRAWRHKGDNDSAIKDFNEAIRLAPTTCFPTVCTFWENAHMKVV
jgi:Tfp pilus assembly protein PilF